MGTLAVERSVSIQAPPERILRAFFDPGDLSVWWRAIRSVTVPRPLGAYAIEWADREFADELLGTLGGTFHGVVMEYRAGAEFFLGEAYWSPPAGESIGPMALEVRCSALPDSKETRVTVRQSAEDDGPRWQRYFQVIGAGWQTALADLKRHLERKGIV